MSVSPSVHHEFANPGPHKASPSSTPAAGTKRRWPSRSTSGPDDLHARERRAAEHQQQRAQRAVRDAGRALDVRDVHHPHAHREPVEAEEHEGREPGGTRAGRGGRHRLSRGTATCTSTPSSASASRWSSGAPGSVIRTSARVGGTDVGERGAAPLGAVGEHDRPGRDVEGRLLDLGVTQVERGEPGVEAERARAQHGDVEPQRPQRRQRQRADQGQLPRPRLAARQQQPDVRVVGQLADRVQGQRHDGDRAPAQQPGQLQRGGAAVQDDRFAVADQLGGRGRDGPLGLRCAAVARAANGGSIPGRRRRDGSRRALAAARRAQARWSRSRRTVISDAPVADASSATATWSASRSRSTMIRCRSALFTPAMFASREHSHNRFVRPLTSLVRKAAAA